MLHCNMRGEERPAKLGAKRVRAGLKATYV
jgi:hypothetical protein